jgi:tetratricopeptide (TPR) repeat protein
VITGGVAQLAAFSPDGQSLAVRDEAGTLSVWDSVSGDLLIPVFPARTGPMEWIWFSRDGRSILGQMSTGEVLQWNLPAVPGSRTELADLLRLLTAHQIDSHDGLERLSRTTLLDDPERFRRAWLAWRSAIEKEGGGELPSELARQEATAPLALEGRRGLLARWARERTKIQILTGGTQGQRPPTLDELDRAIAVDPDDPGLWRMRGDLHARHARWNEALDDLERVAHLEPSDVMSWYRPAGIALMIGDDDRYRRLYRPLMDRFGGSDEVAVVGKVLKLPMLKPATAAEGKRAARVVEDLIARNQAANFLPWFLCSLALADHRAGENQRALERLDQASKTSIYASWPSLHAFAVSVAALAHDRLGQRKQALNDLSSAKALLRANLWDRRPPLADDWLDWVFDQVLYHEAEARLVYDPIFPADPFAP